MNKVPLPKEVFIDFTNKCNYRCVFCTNKEVRKKRTLRLDKIDPSTMELIKQAEIVDITGWGEVTTHPDFEEIIQFLKDNKKQYTLTTNGFLLNDKTIDIIKNSSIKSLDVSVNSLTKENYGKIHGVSDSCFDVVMSNVKKLNAGRKFFMSCSFVMTTINFEEIEEIIRFGAENKIHVVLFDLVPASDWYYSKDLRVPDTEENRKKLANALELAKKLGVSIFSFSFDKRSAVVETKKTNIVSDCRWIYDKIFIRWDGVVTPCCWCLEEMGNVVKQPLDDVWNGEKYTELRNCIGKNDPKYCKNCRARG